MEFTNSIQQSEDITKKMWDLMNSYQPNDKKSLQESIVTHIEYTLARTRFDF
jgi:starch phosphorylase